MGIPRYIMHNFPTQPHAKRQTQREKRNTHNHTEKVHNIHLHSVVVAIRTQNGKPIRRKTHSAAQYIQIQAIQIYNIYEYNPTIRGAHTIARKIRLKTMHSNVQNWKSTDDRIVYMETQANTKTHPYPTAKHQPVYPIPSLLNSDTNCA